MTKLKQCKGGDSNYGDYGDVELDRVEEKCNCCNKRMTNVKYIYTNLDDGNYYCKKCVNTYNINAIPCAEMNY